VSEKYMNRSSDMIIKAGRFGRIAGQIAFARVRQFALPLIAAAFGLYVTAHSPLRDIISASLGLKSRACYFVCADALTFHGAADSLSAWTLIVAAIVAAWFVSDWFDGASYERPLVFGLSALGFISVPAAIFGGLGSLSGSALLRPPLGPLLSAAPAFIVMGAGLRSGWRPHWSRPELRHSYGLIMLVGGLAAVLLFTSTVIALMYPPSGYDALAYHAPLAVFLWNDGNLTAFLDRIPRVSTLANPGTAQLWYGLLLIAGGEHIANLGQLPFALLGSAAACAFARRLGLHRAAAQLAGGAFLLAPIVVTQAGIQVADVAAGGLLMATISLASAPLAGWKLRRFALLGLAAGLIATTKLALLPGAAAILALVGGAAFFYVHASQRIRVVGLRLAVVSLFFLVVIAPWWIRNVRYGNPVYPAGIPFIGRGTFIGRDFGMIDTMFVPTPALWPFYPLLEKHSDRSGFGGLFAVGVIFGSVMAVCRGRRQPLFVYAVVLAITLPTWWLITNHDPRFLLALPGLGFAFLPYSLLAIPRQHRRVGGGLLAAAAIFSTLVTFDQAFLPLAQEPMARLEFYDRVWGVDPRAVSLPENEGILLHTGHATYTYPAFYPLLGPSQTRVVVCVDTEATTDSIIATMRRNNLRYAYVTAAPKFQATVEQIYNRSRFALVHVSTVDEGGLRKGIRRYLYRLM
jgi:hypothetical protein